MPIDTKTWIVGEPLTSADMNEFVRDVVEEFDPSARGQGDLLLVNAALDGFDWFDVSANPGKFLRVNSGGDGLEGATLGIFGTGADGALNVASGTTTVTADKNYTTVTVAVGATLVVRGAIIRATQSIEVNGTCHNDGGAGAGAGAGSGGTGAAATGGFGTAGANGGDGANGSGSGVGQAGARPSSVGDGGAGGAGTGTVGAGGVGGSGRRGGAGGGGGASDAVAGHQGGGGGGGGGCMALYAPTISGSGAIRAAGGAGSNASTQGGGGGGGGGGYIETATLEAISGPTISAPGGAGGSGAGGGSTGSSGAAGTVVQLVLD